MIRISGYIADEKVAIARRYLEPQCQKLSGVPADGIDITVDAMYTLITEYARYVPLGSPVSYLGSHQIDAKRCSDIFSFFFFFL